MEEESRAQRGIARPENATPPEDCTIAHPLVFYPLVVAFRHPSLRSTRGVPRISLFSSACAGVDSSVQQRIYKSVSSVSFVPLGSPDPNFSSGCSTHAHSILCKTRDSSPSETTTFLPSNRGSARRVNFER